jgi:hypothetical protein
MIHIFWLLLIKTANKETYLVLHVLLLRLCILWFISLKITKLYREKKPSMRYISMHICLFDYKILFTTWSFAETKLLSTEKVYLWKGMNEWMCLCHNNFNKKQSSWRGENKSCWKHENGDLEKLTNKTASVILLFL